MALLLCFPSCPQIRSRPEGDPAGRSSGLP
jgi:hypothetical protein